MIYKAFHLNAKIQILFPSSSQINAKATWAFIINRAKCRNPGMMLTVVTSALRRD